MAVKLVLNNFSLVGKTLFGQSKDQGVKSFGLVISFQQTFLLHRVIFCLFFFLHSTVELSVPPSASHLENRQACITPIG